MDDFRQELAGLRLRLRLQMMVVIGALLILAFSVGGADAVARALVESDAWKICTKDAGGVSTPRLVVTTDVATARIKVQNANIELAPQATLPSAPNAGALAYDSTAASFKYWNGSAWVDAAGPKMTYVTKTADESVTSSTTVQDDDHLFFSIAANEVWVAEFWIDALTTSTSPDIKFALTAPTGATITYWVITSPNTTSGPDNQVATKMATASGTEIAGGLSNNIRSGFILRAWITNSTTAGQVKLRWAQNSSSATAVTLKAGSHMVATRF